MFIDGRGVTTDETLTADVAVIGAGAAGIVLARRLGEAGLRVLVIESGDRELDVPTQELYAGASTGIPYFSLESARLRYFGGSTNHWGGTCRPMDDFDLAPHAWIPGSGWPIGTADLAPYYSEAGDLCGLPSSEWNAEVWVDKSPYPALELQPDRIANRIAQNVRASRRRFARRFGDALDDDRQVTVVVNANLVEIELDEAGDRVDRLHLRTLEGTAFFARARAAVLATGGIENPRLLLASNRRRANGIGNQNGLVGRYFLEHPRFNAAVLAPFDRSIDMRFYQAHDAANSRITGYLALPEAQREAEGLVDVQFDIEPRYPAFYDRARHSERVAALRALLGRSEAAPELLDDVSEVADDLTSWRRFFSFGAPLPVPLPDAAIDVVSATEAEREALIPEFFGDIATLTYGESVGHIPLDAVDVVARIDPVPNIDSRVRLGADVDALGVPRVELDWRLSDLDRMSVGRALELLAAEVGRSNLGRLRITYDATSDAWPEDLAGGWHHMGTTRMHDDPRHGVVDRDCRVHGMRNLYVAGSSVFTTATSATPTLTLVALALRLADHLQDGLP